MKRPVTVIRYENATFEGIGYILTWSAKLHVQILNKNRSIHYLTINDK